ncbi:hypothetical protein J6590_082426 [Homalodisca vitripennis]|nr:hypothetical protein J6590_082426 [Homalodisca vitripennis]
MKVKLTGNVNEIETSHRKLASASITPDPPETASTLNIPSQDRRSSKLGDHHRLNTQDDRMWLSYRMFDVNVGLRGREIHEYETRGRDNYCSGMHRTVVDDHLPSQAGVNFINRLPNKIKNASTPKVLKTRIKLCLSSNAFYSVDEFLAFNWETTR